MVLSPVSQTGVAIYVLLVMRGPVVDPVNASPTREFAVLDISKILTPIS
jgi:hypothetical protein